MFETLDLQHEVNAISESVHKSIGASKFNPPKKRNPPSEIPIVLPAFTEENATLVSQVRRRH